MRVALRINIGKNTFYFGIAERLRTLRYPIFMERGRNDSCTFSREKGISS